MGKKLVSWALTLCMLLTMLPTMAWAAETKIFDLTAGKIVFDGTSYTQASGTPYTPAADEKVVITGNGEAASWEYLQVDAGVANVILKDANITVNETGTHQDAGIIRVFGGTLNLELQGTNTLTRQKGGLISVGAKNSTNPTDAVLNITGDADDYLTLTNIVATGNPSSALIGGYDKNVAMSGTINIAGGNIIIPNAGNVGIGSPRGSTGEANYFETHYDINISGGSVAINELGQIGVGIGMAVGANADSEVNVNITGGDVDVVSTFDGTDAPVCIGAAGYTKGDMNVTINGTADVTVTGGKNATAIGASGNSWAPTDINILGGKVTANSGHVAIGASLQGAENRGIESCNITISGGEVAATADYLAIGVAGPANYPGTETAVNRTIDASVVISGNAEVSATASKMAIGMPDMSVNSAMDIAISDTAVVEATATGAGVEYGAAIAIGTEAGKDAATFNAPPAADSTTIAITSPNVTVNAAQPIAAATETALAAGTTYTVGDETITLTAGGTVDSSAAVAPEGAVTIAKGGNTTTITPPVGESLAVNADGTIDAPAGTQVSVNGGETTTLTDGGKLDASTAANLDGFTAKLSVDKTSVLEGDTVTATIAVAGKAFAASQVTVSYDSTKLEYVETTNLGAEGSATDDGAGTITIVDAGDTKTVNEYTITFTAKDVTGDAVIDVTSAAFSTKTDAETKDLVDGGDPAAVTVTITATHAVMLNVTDGTASDWFTYSTEPVTNGDKYSFNAIADKWNNYDYGTVTYTMGGTEMGTITPSAKGAYAIDGVTGDIVITAPLPTAKQYDVTFDSFVVPNAEAKATYGTDYTFTLPINTEPGLGKGYSYAVTSVKINDIDYTGYTSDGAQSTTHAATYTIPGDDIAGDIVITVTETEFAANQFTVTVTGNGEGDVTIDTPVVAVNGTATITITEDDAYENYQVTATMGDNPATVVDNEDGTYSVTNVTGNVVFTVTRELKLTAPEATEYVALKDSKSIWLVTVGNGNLDSENRVYAYDGNKMYWSAEYNAYCYLVVAAANPFANLSNEEIAAKFTLVTGTATAVVYDMNVNMSTGGVDANDAQLVYNMYNTEYSDFTDDVTMEKFLRADVSPNKGIDTLDAAAIVSYLIG